MSRLLPFQAGLCRCVHSMYSRGNNYDEGANNLASIIN
jgi:hypothetical protein